MARACSAGSFCLLAIVGPCSEPATGTLPHGAEVQGKAGNELTRSTSAAVSAPVSEGSAAAARPKQQTPTTRTFMQDHFAESVDMRHAIVAGKLSDLHTAATAVSNDSWTPNLRPDYAPYVSAVQAAARKAASAESLQPAAFALGAIGDACADCHRKFGGPGSPVAPEPLAAEDQSMVAHARATDALWQGLMGPSEASWTAGARTLLDAPALDSDVPDVAAAARHLRDLAQKGTTVDAAGRARLFGDVLLTCATCHERVGVTFRRPAPMK